MIHDVTQLRQQFSGRGRPSIFPPSVAVIRESGGFVWEMRQANLVPIWQSSVHYPTADKAQAAGNRALARVSPAKY